MSEIDNKWDEAMRTGAPADVGNIVVCDWCNTDYTDRHDIGGFIFQSKATCPQCATRLLPDIEKYGEKVFIRATCPELMSFADFVRQYRGGGTTIQVHKFGDSND